MCKVVCLWVVLLLSACQPVPPDRSPQAANVAPEVLYYDDIQNVNPTAAAKLALHEGDRRLWVYVGRLPEVLGANFNQEQVAAVKKVCGFRYIAGFGDVYPGADRMVQLKQLFRYAAAYNQVILPSCSK